MDIDLSERLHRLEEELAEQRRQNAEMLNNIQKMLERNAAMSEEHKQAIGALLETVEVLREENADMHSEVAEAVTTTQKTAQTVKEITSAGFKAVGSMWQAQEAHLKAQDEHLKAQDEHLKAQDPLLDAIYGSTRININQNDGIIAQNEALQSWIERADRNILKLEQNVSALIAAKTAALAEEIRKGNKEVRWTVEESTLPRSNY